MLTGQMYQLDERNLGAMKRLSGQKVLIIGAARQGVSLARFFAMQGAQVMLNDQREGHELQHAKYDLNDMPVNWAFGGHPLSLLEGTDLVCVSAGVPLTLPLIQEAKRLGLPFSNDSQIFMEMAPGLIAGITGSAGKTTTTTLVGRMAEAAIRYCQGCPQECVPEPESGKWPIRPTSKIWVGGNIGTPLISKVEEMNEEDLSIIELSSFQLELMRSSPQVAAVLNITPNHLDRHGTMSAYTEAKARILEYQSGDGRAILNRDDPESWNLRWLARGELVSFGKDEPVRDQMGTFLSADKIVLRDERGVDTVLMRDADIELRGVHNLLNVLAACAIGYAIGLPKEALREGVLGFNGVPHRLEFVREWKGAKWFNDSIATAPERSMAAIRSFEEPLILLAGGRDKDLPWEEFARLALERVDQLILFGEAAEKIGNTIKRVKARRSPKEDRLRTIVHCAGLEDAVATAAKIVSAGDVVLLSPGATSFDEFRDFEERGEAFRRCVLALP
jgi:UDP-N-acetylmuramoylalanine--D-glutamate ligase